MFLTAHAEPVIFTSGEYISVCFDTKSRNNRCPGEQIRALLCLPTSLTWPFRPIFSFSLPFSSLAKNSTYKFIGSGLNYISCCCGLCFNRTPSLLSVCIIQTTFVIWISLAITHHPLSYFQLKQEPTVRFAIFTRFSYAICARNQYYSRLLVYKTAWPQVSRRAFWMKFNGWFTHPKDQYHGQQEGRIDFVSLTKGFGTSRVYGGASRSPIVPFLLI